MSLRFNDLLVRALLEWPTEIDLRILSRSDPASKRYLIDGLYDISDALEARYIGSAEEMIMRNLHWVIYEVLHEVAANVTRVKTSDLRSDAIRSGFEKNLMDCMKMSELGASPQDIELGKRYFAENGGNGAS
jgi:hypothetical protein